MKSITAADERESKRHSALLRKAQANAEYRIPNTGDRAADRSSQGRSIPMLCKAMID
jgi:hypothetical protein